MSASLYLAPGVLERLVGGTLFYPGAGGDFRVPLALFAPLLAEFRFVDRGYFTPGYQDTWHLSLDLPRAEAPPTGGTTPRKVVPRRATPSVAPSARPQLTTRRNAP